MYFYNCFVSLFPYICQIKQKQADLFIIYLLSRSPKKQFKRREIKVLKSEGYLIALLSFPPGINSAKEIGLFTSRAPASFLKQRVLFCKCQILMEKDTIPLRPQIWACATSIYTQSKCVPQQMRGNATITISDLQIIAPRLSKCEEQSWQPVLSQLSLRRF